jgi:hypothetical protein
MLLQRSAKSARPLKSSDGADASHRVIVLRITNRFLAVATRLAIKRLQRTSVPASKLACPSTADPQHVGRQT